MMTTRERELLRQADAALRQQRRPRRDRLTERILSLDPYDLADRTRALPNDVPLEKLLDHFMSAWYCDILDRTEPGWDARWRQD